MTPATRSAFTDSEAPGIGSEWILLLGGVTRSGHRRAQRVLEEALRSGLDVVWFHGLTETEPHAVDVSDSTSGLTIIGFGEQLRATVSGRLRSGDGLRTNAIGRQLWRGLRKIGGLLQPRACWRVIEEDIRRLAEKTPPTSIVYTDDQAITSAWYASRIWPGAPVATDLSSPSP